MLPFRDCSGLDLPAIRFSQATAAAGATGVAGTAAGALPKTPRALAHSAAGGVVTAAPTAKKCICLRSSIA